MEEKRFRILFVCLGNICRSPLGEGIFRHLLREHGLEAGFAVDSCGTGPWCVGEPPHYESVWIAERHGISLSGQQARQVRKEDFIEFDLIVAMDRQVRDYLRKIGRHGTAKIICLREYDTDSTDLDVPDPVSGGRNDFESVFDIIYRCCVRLLEEWKQ